MGAFRSKPIVDKFSTDEENDKLRCASSTMQGWRVTQEDAYNFILDYDKDTSFFSVYDGHGGHEVAEYLQRNLPQFLKDMESYKEGNIEKTLIDGFLKMDASLNTEAIMAVLKNIAMEGADDEENIDKLYEEALMPVEKVIEKYREGKSEETSNESCSKSTCDNNEAGGSKERTRPERSRRKDDDSCSSQTSQKNSSDDSNDKRTDADIAVTEKEEKTDGGADENLEETKSDVLKEKSEKSEGKESVIQNGVVSPEKEDTIKSDSPANEEGEICKGKGKAVVKRIAPIKVDKKNTELPQNDEEIYKKFLKKYVESEEETDGMEGSDDSSDGDLEEDESENGIDDIDEDDDDLDEEDDDESEDDLDDDEGDEMLDRDFEFEKPGVKSGSTGVVAILKGNELYVGNVGDSRCVVCREGKAVEMSFDHKPKTPAEKERIVKAGGEVDEVDDRVNDGLNMSRAFGDYFYKSNKELSQTEQMIIALPDVKTLTIDPNKDEFMVLASDGIWNVKNCQEVIDFLRTRIAKCEGKLSSVIEELFDECLSKYSFADGTDNMTLILVQFKSNVSKRNSSPQPEIPAKKMKMDSTQKESDVKC